MYQAATLLRRIAAMTYDSLISIALLMLATALALPLAEHNAFNPGNHVFQVYLLCVLALSYIWFWTHGGQTLGMLAWRIQLQDQHGTKVSLCQATLYFIVAFISLVCGGIGLLWMLFDKEHCTLYERSAGVRLVYKPKR